jgi:hypothetical protein
LVKGTKKRDLPRESGRIKAMKIESVKIKNFRGYKNEVQVNFRNLTLIVGKNDIGKSTILEALDIFFGNHKPDPDDINITCDKEIDKIEISVEFSGYPDQIDIDAGASTSLKEEFLLNSRGHLEVKKIFVVGSASQPKIYLHASTPTSLDPLITLKNTELKSKASELKINTSSYTASINNSIRKAIWATQSTEEVHDLYIEINKEDGKKIYEKLESEFPIYTLFSADRKNSDQDEEIQTPIKASIKELLKELNSDLEPIRDKVLKRLDEISEGTIKKLEEMNPEVAKTLKSIADKPAWEKAFNINIESDGVPLNKRGSGVKRLVLINFFRQEAERKRTESSKVNVFYSIEEPETSQHPDWQIKLFDAFHELTREEGVQIAITSHHPELCGLVTLEDIRFVKKDEHDKVEIKEGAENNYKEIGNTLGVLPKLEGVKMIVGVEGPNDIEFLKNIAHLFDVDKSNPEILWIPMGGGTLRDYVEKGYLEILNIPQVYLFDRDSDGKYKSFVDQLKAKDNCWAELTKLQTLESYIHPKYYKEVWTDLKGQFVDTSNTAWLMSWDSKDIPSELSKFILNEFNSGNNALSNYGSGKIKGLFASIAAPKMTREDLEEMQTAEELGSFFEAIKNGLS